jgi:hypothetical protein
MSWLCWPVVAGAAWACHSIPLVCWAGSGAQSSGCTITHSSSGVAHEPVARRQDAVGAFSGYTLEDAQGGGAKKAPPPSKPAAKADKKKEPEAKAPAPPQQPKAAAPAPPKPKKGEAMQNPRRRLQCAPLSVQHRTPLPPETRQAA